MANGAVRRALATQRAAWATWDRQRDAGLVAGPAPVAYVTQGALRGWRRRKAARYLAARASGAELAGESVQLKR